MNAVLCPSDKSEMHEVTVEAHYGSPVALEQCRACGGIWFDRYELYSAKPAQAEKIELLDSEILACPAHLADAVLACPRDGAALTRFSDINFPKELIAARCPVCGGFWLNRGEFTKYQKLQKSRRAEACPEDEQKLKAEIQGILAEYKAGKSPETLKKLGSFLSADVDSETASPETRRAFETVMDVLLLILRIFVLR